MTAQVEFEDFCGSEAGNEAENPLQPTVVQHGPVAQEIHLRGAVLGETEGLEDREGRLQHPGRDGDHGFAEPGGDDGV